MDQERLDGLRQEYAEVRSDLRNHTNLRFTIFAVYLAAIGGISSVAFGLVSPTNGSPQHIKEFARFAGLGVTVMFLVYERRIQSLIEHCFDDGKRLEGLLGYVHFKSRPSWGKWRSSIWTTVFFVIMIFFWFVACLRTMPD